MQKIHSVSINYRGKIYISTQHCWSRVSNLLMWFLQICYYGLIDELTLSKGHLGVWRRPQLIKNGMVLNVFSLSWIIFVSGWQKQTIFARYRTNINLQSCQNYLMVSYVILVQNSRFYWLTFPLWALGESWIEAVACVGLVDGQSCNTTNMIIDHHSRHWLRD